MSSDRGYSPVHADRFQPLPANRAERWSKFTAGHAGFFPGLVGLVTEEVRLDYARMRMPFRPDLKQPAGLVHGGAIATLIDTVVVPAIGGGYDEPRRYITIDMQIQYLGALVEQDAIAEGWIVRRGRSVVFCRVEVFAASSDLVATGTLAYMVKPL